MPLLEKGVQTLVKRMPKVISPKIHAVRDYVVAGVFILVGAKSWRRHKRAAVGAFMVAGAELALALMTDYPGGVAEVISFPTHLKVEGAMSGLVGSLPNTMGFSRGRLAWFFRGQGMGMAAVAGLTSVGEGRARRRAA